MLRRTDDVFDPEVMRPLETSDPGLPRFMTAVFGWMAGGVLLSAAAAWSAGTWPPLSALLFTPQGLTPTGWVVTLAPLVLVLVLSGAIRRLSAAMALALYVGYAVLVGLSLGGLVSAYSGGQFALAFCAAAAGFGVMALVGATTRVQLRGLQIILIMGLAGLIFATLLTWLFNAPPLAIAVTLAGVVLFSLLTAYDAQRLGDLYAQSTEGDERVALLGALTLYLDLLNLFLLALRFMGRRR